MIFAFDRFRLDEDSFLLENDAGEKIEITPKALELLLFLVRSPGKLLTKKMIIDEVWGGMHVSDTALPFQVRAIRSALGDTTKPHRIIDTVHGKGLRCVAEVVCEESADPIGNIDRGKNPVAANSPTPTHANQNADPNDAGNASSSGWSWRLPALLTILLVAFAAIFAIAFGLYGDREAASDTAAPYDAPYDAAIAVLPFAQTGAEGGEAYLGEGISDGLASALSRIPGLKVSSKTSVHMLASDEGVSMATLREALGVTHVVEGSVLREGDTVRVTVQLVDAKADQLVWTETYNRQANSMSFLRMQDAIVEAIITQALSRLVEARMPSEPETTSQEAYDLYLRASAAGATRTSEGIAAAIRDLKKATVIDPDFAAAYGLLALTYRSAYDYGGASDPEIYEGVDRASEQALRLAPNEAVTLKAASAAARFGQRTREEIALLQRALAVSPQDAQTLRFLGGAHRTIGQYQESLDYFRRAREFNPLDPALLSELTIAEFNLGNTMAALEVAEANLKWNPQNSAAGFRMAYMEMQLGNYPAAHQRLRDALQLNPDRVNLVATLAAIYLRIGMMEEADEIAARAPRFKLHYDALSGNRKSFERTRAANPEWLLDNNRTASMYFYLGEFDTALPYELKAIEELEITGPAQLGMRETFWNLGRVAVLRHAGNPDAEVILSKIEQTLSGTTPQSAESSEAFFSGAGVQMLKGNQDAAIDWLEAALKKGHVFTHLVRNHPIFMPLGDNPRYAELDARMNAKALEYRAVIDAQFAPRQID